MSNVKNGGMLQLHHFWGKPILWSHPLTMLDNPVAKGCQGLPRAIPLVSGLAIEYRDIRDLHIYSISFYSRLIYIYICIHILLVCYVAYS